MPFYFSQLSPCLAQCRFKGNPHEPGWCCIGWEKRFRKRNWRKILPGIFHCWSSLQAQQVGWFDGPTELKTIFRNGVKQYSAYNSPSKSLGSHIFGKKTIGYKVEKDYLNCTIQNLVLL